MQWWPKATEGTNQISSTYLPSINALISALCKCMDATVKMHRNLSKTAAKSCSIKFNYEPNKYEK